MATGYLCVSLDGQRVLVLMCLDGHWVLMLVYLDGHWVLLLMCLDGHWILVLMCPGGHWVLILMCPDGPLGTCMGSTTFHWSADQCADGAGDQPGSAAHFRATLIASCALDTPNWVKGLHTETCAHKQRLAWTIFHVGDWETEWNACHWQL